jgi:hypothetical protein
MKRGNFLFIVVLLILAAVTTAQETVWFDYVIKPAVTEKEPLKRTRKIHPGVEHFSEFQPDAPRLINVLTIDLDNPRVRIEPEKGGDRAIFKGEKTSEMATRESRSGHIVIAGINADFWRGKYIPVGPFVDEGMIYKTHDVQRPRAVFLIDDKGTPHIGLADIYTTLIVDEKTTYPIDAINVGAEGDEVPTHLKDLFLYTEVFGESTKTAAEGRTEVVLRRITEDFIPNNPCDVEVTEILKDSGNTSLKPGEMVLSGTGESKDFLEKNLSKGLRVKIITRVPATDRPVVLMVGGLPLLLQGGEINIDNRREKIRDAFVTDRHPRTSLGISKDKKTLFLVVVDGRQPGLSIGTDLNWLAQYFKDLGAYEAMNLDGGGSSTMWVRGEIVNSPSDRTGERTVTNSLLVVSKTTQGRAQYLDIYPDSIHAAAEGSVPLKIIATDKNRNPIEITKGDLDITIPENIGRMAANDTFSASSQDAKGKIKASLKSCPCASCYVPVTIGQVASLKATPFPLLLRSGESVNIEITALDDDGTELAFEPADLKMSLPEIIKQKEVLCEFEGVKKGKGEIIISLGESKVSVPVYVDTFREISLFDFDNLPSPPAGEAEILSGLRFDKDKTSLSLEKTDKKQGEAAGRLDYAMEGGGLTAIYIPLNVEIAEEPHEITVWVKGDGKKGWLRAELQDSDGELFLMDFTNGAAGVYWEGWQQITVRGSDIIPKWTNPDARMDFPLTFSKLYVAQSREQYKGEGTLLFDALTAVYPPE